MTATERRRQDGRSVSSLIILALPCLVLRLGRTFLQFKWRANLAGKIFEQELRSQGLEKSIAHHLTKAYMESSSLRRYIQWWQ